MVNSETLTLLACAPAVHLAQVTDMVDGQHPEGAGVRLPWVGVPPPPLSCLVRPQHSPCHARRVPHDCLPAVFGKHTKKYEAAAASSWSLTCDDGSSLAVVMGSVVKKQLWLLALRVLLEREARA